MDYYQTTVKPKHGPEGAVNNVVALLADGLTEGRLRLCADGYAATCRANETEPKYRMKARNFFGVAGGYKAHLAYRPDTQAPSGRDIDAEILAQRQKAARDEVEAQNGGGLQALAAMARANGQGGQP
ncbi:MAG: hypothetical protein ACJ8F7_20885 [Gemmataceae bacterium]